MLRTDISARGDFQQHRPPGTFLDNANNLERKVGNVLITLQHNHIRVQSPCILRDSPCHPWVRVTSAWWCPDGDG